MTHAAQSGKRSQAGFGQSPYMPEDVRQKSGGCCESEWGHFQALRRFALRLALVLSARRCIIWICAWLFVFGVIVLAARVAGLRTDVWPWLGLIGAGVTALAAVLYQMKRLPEAARVRAAYDRANRCGGLVMTQELGDVTAWFEFLGAPQVPRLRWRCVRPLGMFGLGLVFATVAVMLPDRFTRFVSGHPLEIGQVVEELQQEAQILAEEQLIPEEKASELQREMDRLKAESSGLDPQKTWEALDHLRQASRDAASRAAEDALGKLAGLAEAEAIATALQNAASAGLGADAVQSLAARLSALLESAGLPRDGLAAGFQSGADGLSAEQLDNLLGLIATNKCALSNMVAQLAQARLVDAKLFGPMSAARLLQRR